MAGEAQLETVGSAGDASDPLPGAAVPLFLRAWLAGARFFLDDRGLNYRYDPGFGLCVARDVPLLEGYDWEFLSNLRQEGIPERFFGLINPAVVRRLGGGEFSGLLVHGYRALSLAAGILVVRARRLPVLYRSETPYLDRAPGRGRKVLGLLLNTLTAVCLSIGSENDLFYDALGIDRAKRFLVPYVVDNQRFSAVADTTERKVAREKLGLPTDGVIALFAGKLVPWKQPPMLLRAFEAAAPPGAHLVFAGDGELSGQLA